MSQYTGTVKVGDRQYAIEVTADSSRLRATANGTSVFDKKYFVNAGKRDVPIKIGGHSATLRWEMVGSTRGDCSIEIDGTIVPMAQRMKSGEVKAPLTANERLTIQTRIGGAAFAVLGVFLFLRSWFELQAHQRYYTSLGVVPLLVISGLLFLLFPKIFVGQGKIRQLIVIVILLVTLVIGFVFTHWIVGAALGLEWRASGLL